MTMTRTNPYTTTTNTAFASFARAQTGWRAVFQEMTRWPARRRAIAHLSEMSPDLLADIGLQRGDIVGAVCGRTNHRRQPASGPTRSQHRYRVSAACGGPRTEQGRWSG